MASFIVVLSIQIKTIKMRSSKLILKSIAQKVMSKSGFASRFHDLKYFEVGIFFIFLES